MGMTAFSLMKAMVWRIRHLYPVIAATLASGGGRVIKNARLFQLELNSPFPAIKFSELIGNRFVEDGDFVKILPVSGEGSTLWLETVLLAALVKLIRPKAILEIGTSRGRTTWHLFHNAPDDANIYTIDLPPNEVPDNITDKELARIKDRDYVPKTERIKQILIDTRKWDGSLPEKVQFAFIDGSHRYEDVKNDTEKVFRCLDEMACVCWHDSLWRDDGYGVYRFLRELSYEGYQIFRLQEEFETCSIAIWMTPQCLARIGLSLVTSEKRR